VPEHALSLKGLIRRSLCCHADVAHEFPFDAQPFWRCEVLICEHCKARVEDFEVYNDENVRIWPVPEDFDAEFVPSHRSLCAGDEFERPIHLPRRLRRRFLR